MKLANRFWLEAVDNNASHKSNNNDFSNASKTYNVFSCFLNESKDFLEIHGSKRRRGSEVEVEEVVEPDGSLVVGR